ncbi:DUF3987 domain-containing protein [Gibbsiella quercinecans]|uniref:DUF3987 domain-containing protein n=1 Tax=Gibbsiella quercinecans TaxID=929813 RepID=UPI00242B08C2|nr:DUF3987 domain-containing protein [Gibbsiella quercinecans]
MYNDMRDSITPQQVIAIAEAQGLSPLTVSIRSNGYRSSASFWGKMKEIADNSEKYPIISIANDYDVVGKLAINLAKSVQFPESSAYMHFLGVVSSAMLGRFFVEYHGTDQPTSLYVVTSQPPSTGKSAINALAIAPIIAEVDRINEERKKERKRILAKISALKNEMKQEKAPSEMAALYEDLDSYNEKLEKLCDITFPVSDTTPEGLAKINNRQGNFAVISDEATSVNSLLGMTYADASRKTNSELVLKAWDMGHVSIARANADNNMSFMAMGCISVIAQDETIDAIMQAGSRGIGVSERFLLVREESFLGRRKFITDNGDSSYQPIDGELKAQYYRLIHNIMTENNVRLVVSAPAMRRLNRARQELEPDLADNGKYSHTMLRGAMGKFDKQVLRIASVLHTIRNWSDDNGTPSKRLEIDVDTIEEAILMFHELSKTYLSSASQSGYAGESAELKAVYDAIIQRAKSAKGGNIGYRVLYNSVRNLKIFKGQAGLTEKMKKNILPAIEELGAICVVDDKIFINPQLLGG